MKYILTIIFLSSILFSEEDGFKYREMLLNEEQLNANIEQINKKGYSGAINELKKSRLTSLQSISEGSINATERQESELHVAVNPTDSNNILVSPIARSSNPILPLFCPIYYTNDGGDTWQESDYLTRPKDGHAVVGGGDPIFAFDANGVVYLSWIYLSVEIENQDSALVGIYCAESNDGGKSWTKIDNIIQQEGELVPINGQLSPDFDYFPDKQWMAVDRTGSSSNGNVYTSYSFLGLKQGLGQSINVGTYSNDGWETSTAYRSETFIQFSSPEVDSEGVLHVNFVSDHSGGTALYHVKSEDGGSTFTDRKLVSEIDYVPGGDLEIVRGVSASRYYPCPQLAVDDNINSAFKDNLYYTWTNDDEGEGTNINFSKSTDGGNTWSEARPLNKTTSGMEVDEFYSTIAVNNKGQLAITYYSFDANNTAQNGNYFMIISSDGGETFSTPIKLTSQESDFNSIGDMNGGFGIGEYNETISTGNDFIAVWADGRKNDGDVDIYFARVDPNSELTSVEERSSIFGNKIQSINPNPADDIIEISANKEIFGNKYEIVNLSGEIVLSGVFNTKQINVSSLSSGYYLLNLIGDNYVSTKKFIKR